MPVTKAGRKSYECKRSQGAEQHEDVLLQISWGRPPPNPCEDRPEPGRRHTYAAQHVAERQGEGRGRECGHDHGGKVKQAARGHGARRAEAVCEIAEKRRESTPRTGATF